MESAESCSPIPAFTVAVIPLASPTTATAAGQQTIERLRSWPGEHRVAVGLSGGVDSSLTAALLVAAGWRVEGLTLWLMSGKGACCAEGLVDAAGICEQLGIPHHVVDSRETFRAQIVDFLVEGYGSGVTPLPCSRCNRSVKFGPMLDWAQKERGIDRIATGHYARVRRGDSPDARTWPRLKQGAGTSCYGDSMATRIRVTSSTTFPRRCWAGWSFPWENSPRPIPALEAEAMGLRTAKKPESQDLCLADHHGSMKAFLDAYLPARPGEIVLLDGTVVGRHDGIEHFTIGQRKGLGVAWREPLHVVRLDAAMNRVVVAPRSEAARDHCTVGAVNWVSVAAPDGSHGGDGAIAVPQPTRCRRELIPVAATDDDRMAARPHRCRLQFHDAAILHHPRPGGSFLSRGSGAGRRLNSALSRPCATRCALCSWQIRSPHAYPYIYILTACLQR